MKELDEFPHEILRTPQPLIGFSGLDLNQSSHRKVWDVFTSNRGLDRHSLHFVNISGTSGSDFPPIKPKKANYEWYVPKGLLKKNWINKHQNVIPSVVVLFFELNWQDPEIKDKSRICGEKVEQMRTALQGRGTKISVVLMQEESSRGENDSVTSFCTQCEISPRSLFVMGVKDQLLPSVIRLEAVLHELSQNYYHLEIKNVRGHKDGLNKASHMVLMIRHMFKLGYLNEMKNDLHSAQKAYQTAYALILESKLNDFNVVEYKTVAGYINYKICRLGFKLNLPRDAIAQFRKHLDNFKSKTGVPELGWEHSAWQSAQAAMFANLFLDAHRNGQLAIQTQHPGIYFQLAADYAVSRRKLAEEQCNQITSYPEPDPLLDYTEFYGQRPWRPGKIEPVDMQREKEGIEALQYIERTKTKHSQLILQLQDAAVQQFLAFNSPRMKNQVQVQMAEELMIDQKYEDALKVLIECAEGYRNEGWLYLCTATLLKAIKCAFLTINLETYIQLCLDLTSVESECSPTDKLRIEQNLFLVMDLKPPLPEPSLTGKSERASVGQAAKLWKDKLESVGEICVTIPMVNSSINIIPNLPQSSKIGDSIKLTLDVRNSTNNHVVVCSLCCKFNLSGFDEQCTVSEPTSVESNSQIQVSLNLNTKSKHYGELLRVKSIRFKLENFDKIFFTKELECAKLDNIGCKLGPRHSNIEVECVGEPVVLIGEWFNFKLKLENKEESTAKDIEVLCWLRDGGDPLISDTTYLSTFPGFPASPTTPGGSQPLEMMKSSVKLSSLPSNETDHISFFIRPSTLGMRAISCELRYTIELDGEPCVCSCCKVFQLEVSPPFSFNFSLLNQLLEETKQVVADESFLIVPEVSCISPHTLVVTGSRMDCRAPLKIENPTHSLEGSELCDNFKLEQGFPALVPHKDLFLQLESETINLGRFYLFWRRKSSDIVNETVFDLQSVKVSRSFLSLKFTLPPFGILRTPAEVLYMLENKTGEVQEYSLTMDPSDSFMFSGPKQLRVKIFPKDICKVRCLLYPLITGNLFLPKLRIVPLGSGGVISLDKCGIVDEIISRTLPLQLLVLPLDKPSKNQSNNVTNFELKEPTVIPNLPFVVYGKKTTKA